MGKADDLCYLSLRHTTWLPHRSRRKDGVPTPALVVHARGWRLETLPFPHNYSAQPGTVAVLTLEENRGGAVTVYDLKTLEALLGLKVSF